MCERSFCRPSLTFPNLRRRCPCAFSSSSRKSISCNIDVHGVRLATKRDILIGTVLKNAPTESFFSTSFVSSNTLGSKESFAQSVFCLGSLGLSPSALCKKNDSETLFSVFVYRSRARAFQKRSAKLLSLTCLTES